MDGRRKTHQIVQCICRGSSSQEQQGVFSSTPRDVISIDFHYIWDIIILYANRNFYSLLETQKLDYCYCQYEKISRKLFPLSTV